VCCGVLQCGTVCGSVLAGVGKSPSAPPPAFQILSYDSQVCCSVLQCVAVCCSVLQCVAVCGSVLAGVGKSPSAPPPVFNYFFTIDAEVCVFIYICVCMYLL